MNSTLIFYVEDTPEWIPHCHSYTETMGNFECVYVAFIAIFYIALVVINIMLSIHCNIKLNIFVSSKYKLPLDLRLLFGFICLFCCTSSILWLIHILMTYFCLTTYKLWIIIGINGDNFYRFGLATLYFLYWIRLNHAFKDTELAVSKSINIFCIIGFIIQLIIPAFTTYFFVKNDWLSGLKCVYLVIIINTFFTLYLLILFIKKIFILASKTQLKPAINSSHIINPSSIGQHTTASTTTHTAASTTTTTQTNAKTVNTEIQEHCHKNTNPTEMPSNTDTTHIEEKKVEIKINYENQGEIDVFSPTIKYIICAFISIASSNLMSLFIIVRSFGYDNEYAWLASLTSGVLDQTINIYCLYLQLPFANGVYWFCCKKLHLFCMDKSFKKTQSNNRFDSNDNEKSETQKVDTVMVNVEETNNVLSFQISN
eukprot:448579_1